jgi:hypothetical protein
MASTIFECDERILSPVLKAHLAKFYELAHIASEHQAWADHFTEDVVLKRGQMKLKDVLVRVSL